MDDPTLALPSLSPVPGRPLKACLDGASRSDAGGLALREVGGQLGLADLMARCLDDPRNPELIVRSPTDVIRFGVMRREDRNDAGPECGSRVQDGAGVVPSGRDGQQLRLLIAMLNLPLASSCEGEWRPADDAGETAHGEGAGTVSGPVSPAEL